MPEMSVARGTLGFEGNQWTAQTLPQRHVHMSFTGLPIDCLLLIRAFVSSAPRDLCAFDHISGTIFRSTEDVETPMVLQLNETIKDDHSPPKEDVVGTREFILKAHRKYVVINNNPEAIATRAMDRTHDHPTAPYRRALLRIICFSLFPPLVAILGMYILPSLQLVFATLAFWMSTTICQTMHVRRHFKGFPMFAKWRRARWYHNGMLVEGRGDALTPYQLVWVTDSVSFMVMVVIVVISDLCRTPPPYPLLSYPIQCGVGRPCTFVYE